MSNDIFYWEFNASTQLALCFGILSMSDDITSMSGFV